MNGGQDATWRVSESPTRPPRNRLSASADGPGPQVRQPGPGAGDVPSHGGWSAALSNVNKEVAQEVESASCGSVPRHGARGELASSASSSSSAFPESWERGVPPPAPEPELLTSSGSCGACGSVCGAPPRRSALSVPHHRCQPGRRREVHGAPEVGSPAAERVQTGAAGRRAAPAPVNPVTVSPVNVLRSAANFPLKPLKSSKLPGDDLSSEEPAAPE